MNSCIVLIILFVIFTFSSFFLSLHKNFVSVDDTNIWPMSFLDLVGFQVSCVNLETSQVAAVVDVNFESARYVIVSGLLRLTRYEVCSSL